METEAARRVQWDEVTIAEHDKDRGTRMKISEPKTPFRPSHTDGGPAASHSPASMASEDSAFGRPGSAGSAGTGGGDGVSLSDPRVASTLARGWGDGGGASATDAGDAAGNAAMWAAMEGGGGAPPLVGAPARHAGHPHSGGAGGVSSPASALRHSHAHDGLRPHFAAGGPDGAGSAGGAGAATPGAGAGAGALGAPAPLGVDPHDAESGASDASGFRRQVRSHYANEFARARALAAQAAREEEEEEGGGAGEDEEMRG